MMFLLALVPFASGCSYNRLQGLDEQVNQAKAQIQVQLQRRADLIPNLVESVKGVAAQETAVFTAISDARARLAGAVATGDVSDMAEADEAMRAPLSRLLAVVENYPDLKSSAAFVGLMDQLEGTENRIATARTDYNNTVEAFNASIRKFPANLTAKVFGLGTPREYYEATAANAEVAPGVKF
jgi:LemA protein